MHPQTHAIHAGRRIDPTTKAVAPPIVLSTTFEHAPDSSYEQFLYSRYDNPNRAALEECVAGMENGAAGIAFASGMAAIMAVIHGLQSGDHVLAPADCYFAVRRQLTELYAGWGLQASFVDMSNLDAVRAAMQTNTRLVWTETPSNPGVFLTDIAAVAEIAHTAGAICVCDNTWATPLLQKPLDLGCDIVMHSTTKYLAGHSDVLGGILVLKERGAIFERLKVYQKVAGAVPSPFDCWLVLRSISTLPQRMAAHCDNAEKIAQFLAAHPNIEKVHYPGLAENRFHELAKRQMARFGGMLSVEVAGGWDAAIAVCGKVKLFTCATSLGAVESLIEHRASVEGPESPTPRGLLRLSVGLEHYEDLIADLAQALE
ncbi:MAG: aminotransferase class V-fold PLP-dependent enzyme [Candidatus Kapaibacterium sp.]|nr:MAG: aminotransferase class V-fold PLP-dependent enzyme [Candidatus Kapabacteria bacterium]